MYRTPSAVPAPEWVLRPTCSLYFRYGIGAAPFLPTAKCGDGRHPEPSEPLGEQLLPTQGSWDMLGPCRELGADLILLFHNNPPSNVISADGGSKTKSLYTDGRIVIESDAQSQGEL